MNTLVSLVDGRLHCASKEQYAKAPAVHLLVAFSLYIELPHKSKEIRRMSIKL